MIPAALVGVLILVVLPFDAYRNVKAVAISRAALDGTPMRDLKGCLLDLQAHGAPAGVYLRSPDTMQWKYVYYLRDAGWHQQPIDDRQMRDRLLVPSAERPVFVSDDDYRHFLETLNADPALRNDVSRVNAVTRLLWNDGQDLLLPGPYAACGHVKSGVVHAAR